MPRFTHDAMTDHVWECSGFDAPWNGWASPVVSASVVLGLMEESGWHWTAKGRTITVVDDPGDDDVERWVPLEPDEQGYYHLRMLGWTFLEYTKQDGQILDLRGRLPKMSPEEGTIDS